MTRNGHPVGPAPARRAGPAQPRAATGLSASAAAAAGATGEAGGGAGADGAASGDAGGVAGAPGRRQPRRRPPLAALLTGLFMPVSAAASGTATAARPGAAGNGHARWPSAVGATAAARVTAAADDWRGRIQAAVELVRRELEGGTEADQFGFDPEFSSRVLLPLARLFYQHWFSIQMRGLEHVPAGGAALVVANHSGTLPMDAIMLQTGVHDEHPAHRNLRLLGADLVYEIPLLASIARKGGHTRACPANAHQLLCMGELVGVFPEGFKGIGKPFSDRYQLRRFGRGGFAATAMRARAPIIPCAIVGAEEIYPLIGDVKPLARLLRLPYFPVTPLFPWLGPLGTVPLPSRWIIEFCPPVPTDDYAPGDADDTAAVADLSGRVRGIVQRKLDDLIADRGPAFG